MAAGKSDWNINKIFLLGGIVLVILVVVYFLLGRSSGPKTGSSTRVATAGEKTGDCFIPKEGDAECIVDIIGVMVERVSTGGECQGVRATIETDKDLEALDPGLQGEVVAQVHPKGQTNDGSADTGVGMGHYSGREWSTFSFGPDGRVIAKETYSAEMGGRTVIFELKSFADGSCISDDAEMRVKLEMAEGSTGSRIYDTVPGGLMDYLPVGQYPGTSK